MTVSVISTVLNERYGLGPFLESLLVQTQLPDEIVILDGGSSDGTREYLEEASRRNNRLRVIVDPTCNIRFTPSPVARGRNKAILASRGEIIAVTDAGCTVDEHWLEAIVLPFLAQEPVDVVGGWYEPQAEGLVERTVAAVSFPATKDRMRSVLAPSSRSIAFTREIWERAGGYPEVALTAEDTMFNARLQAVGARYKFAERAIVHWRPRNTLRTALRQFYRYSRGDAISGLRLWWHAEIALRFLVFGAILLFAALKVYAAGYLALLVVLLYALHIARQGRYRATFPFSFILKVAVDAARILGYADGCLTRLRGRQW